MSSALAFLGRTKDAGIEVEVQTLQGKLGAVLSKMKERAGLLTLEEAIAATQAKCERLATTGLNASEAARFPGFDHTSHRQVLRQTKVELKALIAKCGGVESARREQAADEGEVATIRQRLQETRYENSPRKSSCIPLMRTLGGMICPSATR